jgi:copper transport protein
VILGVGLLVTPGLSGHAARTAPVILNLSSSTLHLAAAACWVGGSVMLIAAVYPATATIALGDRVRILATVVSRFSDTALLSVGVLVVSGSFRSWAEVRSLSALTGTAYGVVLLGKLTAFLPMLGLERSTTDGSSRDSSGQPRLRRPRQHPC